MVVLLARWSRVLGRLTQRGFALACGFLLLCLSPQRGFALACGFLLLCLSRTPLLRCFAVIIAPDTVIVVPVQVAGSRPAAA